MSKQDYGTPREFMDAVALRFGPIAFDLAANEDNHVVDEWLGPGSSEEDSFAVPWNTLRGNLWLNPPFGKTGDWAKRCALESGFGARILMLIQASIGASYFTKWIWPFASVYALSPRLKFIGQAPNPKTGKIDPFTKDLILCDFNRDTVPVFECWRWDESIARAAQGGTW